MDRERRGGQQHEAPAGDSTPQTGAWHRSSLPRSRRACRRGASAAAGSRALDRHRRERGDRPAAVQLVDDVDRVVLAVGAGDPEEASAPSGQNPSLPSCASGRWKRRLEPTTSKSVPSTCGTPLTKTSNGRVTSGGSSTLRPALRSRFVHWAIQCQTAWVGELLVVVFACLGVLTLAAAAAAGNGGLLPPAPHSPNAQRISNAYIFVLVFTGIVFVLVEGVLIAFVIRYRRGKRARTLEGPQIHGSTKLEIALDRRAGGHPGRDRHVRLLRAARRSPTRPPRARPTRRRSSSRGASSTGCSRYPNGAVSIGRMVAPADKVVHEDVTSPDNDVNHSWWVPRARRQDRRDPGPRRTTTWFKAPAGSYVARCAELCGIQHARMTAVVEVVPRGRVRRGSSPSGRATTASRSARRSSRACASTATGSTRAFIGPALGRQPAAHRPRGGSRRSFARASATMPAVGSDWTDAQIDALVAYTKTLQQGPVAARAETENVIVPYRADWRRGTAHVVADDGRPQADRDPLHLDRARLLRHRRRARAADAHAARDAERGLPDARRLQRGAHDPRHDDDLPRHRPDPRGLRRTSSCR